MDLSPDAQPWSVPAEWSPVKRLQILSQIARNGAQSEAVKRWCKAFSYAETNREKLTRLLVAVQSLPYVPDDGDTYQGVNYTLAHGGDCEDLDTLFGACCLILGVPCGIEYLAQPNATQDHVTNVVELEGQWCFAEVTIPGAQLCENPYDAVKRLGYRYRLRGQEKGTGLLTENTPWRLLRSNKNTWDQWVQLDNAGGWLLTAVDRFNREASIETLPYTEQSREVINAWQAIEHFYRSLDLPATIDPLYLSWLNRWWGNLKHYPPPQCLTTRVNPEVSTGRRGDSSNPSEIKDRVITTLARLGKNKVEWERKLQALYTRCALNDHSELRTNTSNPLSGVYTGCAQENATSEGCTPYNWHSVSWMDVPTESVWIAVPALRWVYEAGQELVSQLATRGVENAIEEARNYQLALNIKAVIEQSKIDGTEAEIMDLITATANIPLAGVVPEDRSGINQAAAGIALAGAFVATANPVVGGAIALFASLIKLLPAAQGWDIGYTSLGRCVPRVGPNQYGVNQYNQPIYTAGWIDGSDTVPPAFAVPVAPRSGTVPAMQQATEQTPERRRPRVSDNPFRLQHGVGLENVPTTPNVQDVLQRPTIAKQLAPPAAVVPVVATMAAVGLATAVGALVYAAK